MILQTVKQQSQEDFSRYFDNSQDQDLEMYANVSHLAVFQWDHLQILSHVNITHDALDLTV